jgi:serine/threonine-protein kinase
MTEAGSIIGTAQYLSPEQARGAPVDQTSDLYSVGVVLYELLTGMVPFSGDTPVEIAMKHLSAVPEPPSSHRAEIPRDLDLVILRALAKDPAERYQSAEEMDEDLSRVQRGGAVSPATEEAATAIISRPPSPVAPTAITQARGPVPYAPPPAYYDYDEPHRRAFWPWVLALLFVAGAIVGGYFLYNEIQNQISGAKSVRVENYQGLREILADQKIRHLGLVPNVVRQPNANVPETLVFRQDPQPGTKVNKGGQVTIYSSSGKPKTTVPSVVGLDSTAALSRLADAGLKWKLTQVTSNQKAGTVLSQSPTGGASVDQGSVVKLKVSKGPQPVAVPNVVGASFATASSQLQGAGFAVARKDVQSDQPAETVVAQSPLPGASAAPGSTITLSVSKGPKTSAVPDVTSQDQTSAQVQLKASGFRVRIVTQPTSDQAQDGIVLSQDPAGGTQAPPGTVVTIVVGKFSQSPPP